MTLGRVGFQMCKESSNSNKGETYEKEFKQHGEWVQCWKQGDGAFDGWSRVIVSIVVWLFVMQLQINAPLLSFKCVCTLQPLRPSLTPSDGWKPLHASRTISFSSVPVGRKTTVFILLPLQLYRRKCSVSQVQASLCPQASPKSPNCHSEPCSLRTSEWSWERSGLKAQCRKTWVIGYGHPSIPLLLKTWTFLRTLTVEGDFFWSFCRYYSFYIFISDSYYSEHSQYWRLNALQWKSALLPLFQYQITNIISDAY